MADRCDHCGVRMDGLEVHSDTCPKLGHEPAFQIEVGREVLLAAAILKIEAMKPVFDAAVAWARNAGCPPFWGSEDGRKLFLACGKVLLSEKRKCVACDTIVQVYGNELCDSCHTQDLGADEDSGGHS